LKKGSGFVGCGAVSTGRASCLSPVVPVREGFGQSLTFLKDFWT
jgi:hypothetical protein